MKNIFLTLASMFCCLAGCTAQSDKYTSLDVAEFEKVAANDNIVLLDVRTAMEYREGHLPGAVNADVLRNDFLAQASLLLPKENAVALYCRSGKRSKKAAQILSDNGYKVTELSTGYNGWTQAGKEVSKQEVDVFTTDNGSLVRIYCIKHGTLRMSVGGKWIYVDPVTDKVPPVTDFSTLPKADLILLTHEHPDHLDAKAISQLTKQDTKLITNRKCSDMLGGKGQVMKNGDSATIGEWNIEAVPAYNTSKGKEQFHPKGRDNGFVLTIDGFRIYIAGDTEDIDEMKDIADIDVAFLPCNQPFTMTPEQVAKATKTIHPKVLFPYHYGNTDIRQVRTLLKDSSTDVRIRQYQ